MADYPLQPDRITEETADFNVNIQEFESGYEQRSTTQVKEKHIFTLRHNILNQTERQTLLDFYKQQKGALLSFNFHNHIDGQNYTVRFDKSALNFKQINAFFCEATVRLIEVF